jgi:UDP-N-acetyl-D-mannosaminuronic acid transferase (WecB/TagA/CpsF family)
MSKQEKANIKIAYQAAAELAHIIAVGLSTPKQNPTIDECEELFDKHSAKPN